MKSTGGNSQRRERQNKRRSEKRKRQTKEDAGARKGRKVAQHCVFSMCCGFGGLKSRLAKAAGAMKNCTQLWREASFQVRMSKAPQCRSTFGSWAVETVHAIVARSTCQSQNVQSTPYPEHFWKIRCWKVHGVVARSTLRCWKSARRCGTKHMSKSKVAKNWRSQSTLWS